jgi:hypothetical protein
VCAWSPEQIANRIRLDFPDDKSMRISHEVRRFLANVANQAWLSSVS